MNSSWLGKLLLSFLFIAILLLLLQSLSHAYYGMYGGLYGLGLSGLYGMGLYGSLGLYGMSSLGGLYGLGRLYGLYGLGGLSSLYGLGGLGGLYGLGLMGMYGSLGLYGMSGLGGLYGLSSISTLGGLGGLGLLGGLYGMGGMGALLSSLMTSPSTTTTTPAPTAAASAILPLLPFFIAEQAGTWLGTWTNGLLGGQMTLNLIEDPLLSTVFGTAQLLGNPTLSALVDVTGEALNSQVIVSGTAIGLGGMNFELQIIGILVAPDQMTGTYNLINLSSGGTVTESGSFELKLVAPII
jgi:hypothetical protein